MARRFERIGPARSGGDGAAIPVGIPIAILVALLALPAAAQAPYATACPPPKKVAAGACVVACPAGYEDQGRVCVYRNLSR